MPCYDHRSVEDDRQAHKNADERASMLCAVLRNWERAGQPFQLPDGVVKWWAEHKKFDDARKAKSGRKY